MHEKRRDVLKVRPYEGLGPGWSDAVEDGGDEVADGVFVVGVDVGVVAVGDDGADGHGLVAHEAAETLEGCALHLVVGDLALLVAEGFNAAVEVRIGQGQTQLAALGAVETHGGDGDAAHHVIAADALHQ